MILTKPCKICKKIIIKQPSRSLKDWHNRTKFCSKKCLYKSNKVTLKGNQWNVGKKLSLQTRKKMSLAQSDEKHSQWKGEKVGYVGLHNWLHKHYGKANKCENEDCFYPRQGSKRWLEKPYRYEWALIEGKEYKRDRNNFRQLCVSCHRKQDAGHKKKINN